MTAPNSPWADYPPDYAPEDDDTYQPAPLAAATIALTGALITGLALWKLADIAGAVYSWSIS